MPTGKLLVVEDDETIRGLLVECLRQRPGIDCDVARDGAEALHQLASCDYAVVVLDLVMPHMSGIDFLDSLAALASDPSVKSLGDPPAVLIITGEPEAEVPTDELEHRFPSFVRGVMRKPLDLDVLASRVTSLL